MSRRVLGIDLDTHKVSCVLLSDMEEFRGAWVSEGKGKAATDRFPGLVYGLNVILRAEENDDALVAVEDVPFIKNRHGFAGLAQVLGAVRAAAALSGHDVVVLRGAEWKKALGLSGNANKEAIAAWVAEDLKRQPDGAREKAQADLNTQDLLDAYAIAQAASRA